MSLLRARREGPTHHFFLAAGFFAAAAGFFAAAAGFFAGAFAFAASFAI